MLDSTREGLNMLFEFVLSILIIVGAGFMIYKGIASEFACGVLTLVTGFWFTKRSNESAVNNLMKQPPIVTITPPTSDPKKKVSALDETTNPTNPTITQ